MSTTDIAKQKYQKALMLIERAQRLLGDAREELSPLVGAIHQYDLVGKEYENVHNLWRDIAYSSARDNVDLDSDTKARLKEMFKPGDTHGS